MRSFAPLLLLSCAAPAALNAQALPAENGASRGDSSISQISNEQASAPVAVPTNAPSAEAPDQLPGDSNTRPGATQVSPPTVTRQATSQVSAGERDARPPQPLSRPAEGRTSDVEVVQGHDRCDTAARSENKNPKCAGVIENRAGEFARREAPSLSPEQKLLLDQQTRESAADFEQAARRLAKSGQSDDSMETLGVASVVLATPSAPARKPDEPEDPAQSDATAAIINAIVNGGSTVPPQ